MTCFCTAMQTSGNYPVTGSTPQSATSDQPKERSGQVTIRFVQQMAVVLHHLTCKRCLVNVWLCRLKSGGMSIWSYGKQADCQDQDVCESCKGKARARTRPLAGFLTWHDLGSLMKLICAATYCSAAEGDMGQQAGVQRVGSHIRHSSSL